MSDKSEDEERADELKQKGNEKFKGNNLYYIKFERKKIYRFRALRIYDVFCLFLVL